jgi:chitin synthase
MAVFAYLTFGLKSTFCPDDSLNTANAALNQSDHLTIPYRDDVKIYGFLYDFDEVADRLITKGGIELSSDWYGTDITALFEPRPDRCSTYSPQITSTLSEATGAYNCTVPNKFPRSPSLEPRQGQPCPDYSWLRGLVPKGRLFFSWDDVRRNRGPPHTLVVFNGMVMNLTSHFAQPEGNRVTSQLPKVDRALARSVGLDATIALTSSYDSVAVTQCLEQRYVVGYIGDVPIGCAATRAIQWILLSIILCYVLARFFMAIAFSWFFSERLVRDRKYRRNNRRRQNANGNQSKSNQKIGGPFDGRNLESVSSESGSVRGSHSETAYSTVSLTSGSRLQRELLKAATATNGASMLSLTAQPPKKRRPEYRVDPYVILLVTCYSESEDGIRNTVESLARADYPDSRKLLFIIADGLITGHGNSKSTPDAIVGMMAQHPDTINPEPKSYLAIADGYRQHNMAKVVSISCCCCEYINLFVSQLIVMLTQYAGHYYHAYGGVVPIVTVVKCGTPAEAAIPGQKKSGNRGKRDSQLILMNFLSRILFNDHMTPLDHDLAWKINTVTGGLYPDIYQLVLMVDADTKVESESLHYMVQAMKNDESIIGLCGETRIANKRISWVTAIQVFEYYISHHLGKAFESIFGGVTCLPGCFCMYRIKAPKGPAGAWTVPILANPDIVEEYSENVVDTLHKKNLLLLGEDRFLTTLMLRTFPKRKLVFVPQAICRTVVPDDFKTLLSQRRRWINSTVHNLLELVLLRDLCGIFCFSMQFVVAVCMKLLQLAM